MIHQVEIASSGKIAAGGDEPIQHDAVRFFGKIIADHRDADAAVPLRVEYAPVVRAPRDELAAEATERGRDRAHPPSDLKRVATDEAARRVSLVEFLADDGAAD